MASGSSSDGAGPRIIVSTIGLSGENNNVTAPNDDFSTGNLDAPATADEIARFRTLQRQLTQSFTEIFGNLAAPRTVLILPSLSFDQQIMAKVSGVHHYEERMLCLLLLLRHAAHPGDLCH